MQIIAFEQLKNISSICKEHHQDQNINYYYLIFSLLIVLIIIWKLFLRMDKRQDYFSFFNKKEKTDIDANNQTIKSAVRPKSSQYKLQQKKKMLPHIVEEYQYRITNQLLEQKIRKPRRDKIIVESLAQTHKRKGSRSRMNHSKTLSGTIKKQHTQFSESYPKQPTGKWIEASLTTEGLENKQKDQGIFPLEETKNILGNEMLNSRDNEDGDKENFVEQFEQQLSKQAAEGAEEVRRSRWKNKKRALMERPFRTFDNINSSCNNYMDDYLISLENNRMGRRIINTRSTVQDILSKTYYTYQVYNGKILNRDKFLRINSNSIKFRNSNKNFGKLNNGIKSFFRNLTSDPPNASASLHHCLAHTETQIQKHQTIHLGRNQSSSRIRMVVKTQGETEPALQHHGFETNNPCVLETFGRGQMTLILNSLVLISNPLMKKDAILQIQIIQNEQTLSQVVCESYGRLNNFYNGFSGKMPSQAEGCYTSAPFPYEYLSQQLGNPFGLKFRIHFKNMIFLRLMKTNGINHLEIGVIALNLEQYRSKKGNQNCCFRRQTKIIDGVSCYRDVMEQEIEGPLRKINKGEISTSIKLKFQLLERRFLPVEKISCDFTESYEYVA